MSTDKERMETLLAHLKMNANEFASSLGYKRTDKIYNVIKERNGISAAVARDIHNVYQNINYEWLVDGTGEMLSRASPEKIKLNITMPEMPKMPETPNMIVKPLVYEKRKNTTMDMVKRLRLAVPEAKDTRASILMQHLFEQNPSVGLWVATGRDDKVVIDRMELEALRGQVAALKLLNESQSKEIEAIRKANI